MKSETKILLGLAAVGLVLFVLACCILKPTTLSAAIIAGCGIIAVLTTWWVLARTVFPGPVATRFALNKLSTWPQRTSDPDKLVDRLVSSMEEFIANVCEDKVLVEHEEVRQRLHYAR